MPEIRLLYDDWHRTGRRKKAGRNEERFYNRILEILEAKRGRSLLDLGCGKGNFCYFAFNQGLKAYGVDFSTVALKEAKAMNIKMSLVLSDAALLPFKDGFFDYIVCLGSLEHFTDKVSAFREVHRVLKNEGKIFIFLPNSYFLGHIYFVWKRGLPPDEAGQDFSEQFNTRLGWQKIIEENSFQVTATYNFNAIWASSKVSLFSKYIYNLILRHFIPVNLSYAFGYLCLKR